MCTARSLELAERVWGWKPHSDIQREWMLTEVPVKVGCWGRRAGKTESTAIDTVLWALEHPHTTTMIVAPTYGQVLLFFQEVLRRVYAIPGMANSVTFKSTPYLELSFNDGHGLTQNTRIAGRTAGHDGKGIRGEKCHRLICDEAAYIADQIMADVLAPLLADYDGALILISTPAGMNHFKAAFDRGVDPLQPRYKSFHCPSTINPHLSASYLENERLTKPERVYRIEYLAEFADDEGQVFRNVLQAIDKGRTDSEAPKPGMRYYAGWDLARINDFSVLTILDKDCRQVYHDRFQKLDWDDQVARVKKALDAYNSAPVVMDTTGGLESVSQTARKAGLKVTPFVFTNQSKRAIMDALALKIETTARLLDNPVQTGELQAYAYTLTAARNVTMNAPEGQHDDCVCSLALATHGLTAVRYATAL